MTVATPPRRIPQSHEATTVLALCDDDASVASEFDLRGRLDAALSTAPTLVVVDLSRCHYLDAPGLRVLVEARDRASREGVRLELRGCSPEALRLLQAAGHPVDLWRC